VSLIAATLFFLLRIPGAAPLGRLVSMGLITFVRPWQWESIGGSGGGDG
jgi:hypothetical protein